MELCGPDGRYIFGYDCLNERCGDKTQTSFVPALYFLKKCDVGSMFFDKLGGTEIKKDIAIPPEYRHICMKIKERRP